MLRTPRWGRGSASRGSACHHQRVADLTMWRRAVRRGVGNPAGNRHHTRHLLNQEFMQALLLHFRQHGKKAIEKVAREQPAAYLKILALLVPREHKVEQANFTQGPILISGAQNHFWSLRRWRRRERSVKERAWPEGGRALFCCTSCNGNVLGIFRCSIFRCGISGRGGGLFWVTSFRKKFIGSRGEAPCVASIYWRWPATRCTRRRGELCRGCRGCSALEELL